MREIVLAKYGEIALKGLNKRVFEKQLMDHIRTALAPLGQVRYQIAQSTIFVEPSEEIPLDQVMERLRKVFGLASLCRCGICGKEMGAIEEFAGDYLSEQLTFAATFKVEAKRSDKAFPLKSPEICDQVGGALLERYPHLRVDVHNPDVTVTVEIRDFGACVHAGKLPGAGGMPVGSAGKGALLLSGGIDSPVAGYMMAKRGLQLDAVHFYSYPYTSERAKNKVIDLAKLLTAYCGPIRLHVVPFTHIQEEIRRACPEDLFTLVMRRFMMRIAQEVARRNGCDALVTGESLGQVASQTLKALGVTDSVCDMPVFRPVIGMDKEEIVTISRKIGTFETSILPYEDCCTVFTPKHPKTRPERRMLEEAEARLEVDTLVREAVSQTEKLLLD